MFKDRKEAGLKLVQLLKDEQIAFDIVMGIPRGGVLVGEVVAAAFGKTMDVVMVKKLESSNLLDFALGAVTPDGEILRHQHLDENLIETDPDTINRLAARVMFEINQRLKVFRSYRPAVNVKGNAVLLVDDGIASGFTVKAAASYLRRQGAIRVIVAVPVCAYNAYLLLGEVVDSIISLKIPRDLYAVSQFYQDFSAVEDNDIIDALLRLNPGPAPSPPRQHLDAG
ncbi:MAG TPA: phosphoribosyltransferase family protein [Syntrophomonadaceae bacterium]|nr:phosphoribosyltransferase family protein [Syntrophomonadaceae bacterium]